MAQKIPCDQHRSPKHLKPIFLAIRQRHMNVDDDFQDF